MRLVIKNKIINAPITQILDRIVAETHKPLFRDRINNGNNLTVTCPCHKNGNEQNPSCNIMQDEKNPNVVYGLVHCFTCGYKATLPQLVADCFDIDIKSGEEWLYDRFAGESYKEDLLPPIDINKPQKQTKYLDESILIQYDFYHPYMWERHLTKEVVDMFRVGYDKIRNAITFPVYDEHNKLALITARSVETKQFWIDKGAEKPVYLLNYIINNNITTVYVCESQINALTLWGWGYPAIALFGTGSTHQYEVLKKSGIRHYIMCLDGDNAGDNGIRKFRYNFSKDVLITQKEMPRDGRDVNDLSKEEFDNLKEIVL